MSSDLACYTFTPPQTGPFSLVIPPTTYCAGSDVDGEVLLKFPQVQDEQIDQVTVELRGKLKVSVLVLHSGSQRAPSVERQELIYLYLKQSLWMRGSAYPPPDSHVLRLPFRFHLPPDPKILRSVWWDRVVITYDVEAIALRPRAFFAFADDKHGTAAACPGPARHPPPLPRRPHPDQGRNDDDRAKADRHPEGKPVFPAIELGSDERVVVRMRQTFTVRACGVTKEQAGCDARKAEKAIREETKSLGRAQERGGGGGRKRRCSVRERPRAGDAEGVRGPSYPRRPVARRPPTLRSGLQTCLFLACPSCTGKGYASSSL